MKTLLSPVWIATLALTFAGAAAAHDWPSPPPPHEARARDVAQPAPAWPGLRWAGPHAGRPSEPQAGDCMGAARRFSVESGLEQDPQTAKPREPRKPHGAATPGMDARGLASTEKASRDEAGSRVAAPGPVGAAPAKPAIPSARVMLMAPAMNSAEAASLREREPRQAAVAVSAGMVDDNADFGAYTRFHERHGSLLERGLLVRERVRLSVQDAQGRAVPDATVSVSHSAAALPLWARTDAGGQAWLMPQADMPAHSAPWEVEVRTADGRSQRVLWSPGQKDALQIRLPAAASPRARLDIAFVIDATGSMADEIDKLKASMRSIAEQIDKLPSSPDLCWSMVAYRDRGDEFFVRGLDFTSRLADLQADLNRLQAGGGGDYPEAANEAMHSAIHQLHWRGTGTARLLIHVADAPPHEDYGAPHFDHNARAALARGIKVMSIGASGLNRTGEMAMRQMAQFTGGRFVFLTYANAADPSSGSGRQTLHEVDNYSVETLDRLVVRLVSEEMARWPG